MGFTERENIPFPYIRVLLDESEVVVDMERIHDCRNDCTLQRLGISLFICVEMLSDDFLKDKISSFSKGSFPSTAAHIETLRLSKVFPPQLRISTVHFVLFAANAFLCGIFCSGSQPRVSGTRLGYTSSS